MRRLGLSLIVVLALSAAVGSASGRALGSQLSCGDTITVNTKLTIDLVNCPNNGLVIGADNVTLDLDGHVVDGDDAEFTDCPPDEACDIGVLDFDHQGVTIKGGEVGEFTFGSLVIGATDSRLTRLDLSHNFFSGLLVAESSRSQIDLITATANGLTTDQAGVDVFDSHELTIARNTVFANGDIGYFVSGLDDSRFEENSIADHPEAGILLDHGNGNEFSHNRLSNNQDGIVVSGDANTVAGNWLSGPVSARRSAASASRWKAGPATRSRATSFCASTRPAFGPPPSKSSGARRRSGTPSAGTSSGARRWMA